MRCSALALAVLPLLFLPAAAELLTLDVQGHRGARGLFPENTLLGFEASIALGVTTLEMDLVLTRDGVLVVHHDRRLDPDRTRNGTGEWLKNPTPALKSLTFDEVQAFDVGRLKPGSEIASRFPGQQGHDGVRIPRLREVLARCEALSGGRLRYNIETKTSPLDTANSPTPEAIAQAVVAVLRDAGVTQRAVVQSFDWRTLNAVQRLAPEIGTAHLTVEQPWMNTLERGRPGSSPWLGGLDLDPDRLSVPAAVARAGGAVWSPYFRDITASDIEEAQKLGLKVAAWTVNHPEDMADLIDMGVDAIITDYPDRLRQVMTDRGLPLPPAFQP